MAGLVRGALPNPHEIVLSMELMNAVEEVDISSGAAVTQAGTPLQTIQDRVGQEGYMFPLNLGARQLYYRRQHLDKCRRQSRDSAT